jgi:hypothetical protein
MTGCIGINPFFLTVTGVPLVLLQLYVVLIGLVKDILCTNVTNYMLFRYTMEGLFSTPFVI